MWLAEGGQDVIQRAPVTGRQTVRPTEAARLLACTRETVKNKIRRGDFGESAGQAPDGHWWIYADQLVSNDVQALRRENAQLRQRVEELVAQKDAADRRIQELVDRQAVVDARRRDDRNELATALAMLGATRQATEAYKRAAEGSRRVVDGYKTVTEDAMQSVDQYKEAADQWMAVADMNLDAMAQRNMPDTPEELDDLGR
jgi:phage shock protein A